MVFVHRIFLTCSLCIFTFPSMHKPLLTQSRSRLLLTINTGTKNRCPTEFTKLVCFNINIKSFLLNSLYIVNYSFVMYNENNSKWNPLFHFYNFTKPASRLHSGEDPPSVRDISSIHFDSKYHVDHTSKESQCIVKSHVY